MHYIVLCDSGVFFLTLNSQLPCYRQRSLLQKIFCVMSGTTLNMKEKKVRGNCMEEKKKLKGENGKRKLRKVSEVIHCYRKPCVSQ